MGDMTGWAQSGEIQPGSDQAVTMQALFPVAGNYTVQFNITDSNKWMGIDSFNARADITWTINGNSVTRTVDCANGISVSGIAQAVAVRVYDNSVLVTDQEWHPYQVTIVAAPGVRPDLQQPVILTHKPVGHTQFIQILQQTGITLWYRFEMPIDAGIISVFTSVVPFVRGDVIPPNALRAAMFNGPEGKSLRMYDPMINTGWVPIAPGTKYFEISQAGNAPTTLWSITYGIDG
jgi:hypothetical protein